MRHYLVADAAGISTNPCWIKFDTGMKSPWLVYRGNGHASPLLLSRGRLKAGFDPIDHRSHRFFRSISFNLLQCCFRLHKQAGAISRKRQALAPAKAAIAPGGTIVAI